MLQKFDSVSLKPKLFASFFKFYFWQNEVNEFRWDFCDQGMPEFVFEKEGPICKLSIAEGPLKT